MHLNLPRALGALPFFIVLGASALPNPTGDGSFTIPLQRIARDDGEGFDLVARASAVEKILPFYPKVGTGGNVGRAEVRFGELRGRSRVQ